MPEVSDGRHDVTLKIKQGVKFSPPVNREVTAKDVKYAIERGFFNTVNNGYAGAYYGDVKGAKVGVKPGTEIAGIETPDNHTIVFKLDRGTAAASSRGRARDAVLRAGAAGVRREVRREEPVHVRRATRSRPART